MSSPSITIAICTWNRADSLRQTLASLRNLQVPDDLQWEVLIVNNNCTDTTEEVVASFGEILPIRSVTEPRQGQSHARNCAIESARGDYILHTDDEVLVDERWLAAYADAFRAFPDTAVFGGPILPRFVGEPPHWLKAAMRDIDIGCIYALRDLGLEPVPLQPTGNAIPFGANFAIRMREQRQFPFDPRLGLQKSGNVRGEETDVMRKILAAGVSAAGSRTLRFTMSSPSSVRRHPTCATILSARAGSASAAPRPPLRPPSWASRAGCGRPSSPRICVTQSPACPARPASGAANSATPRFVGAAIWNTATPA
jgi:hypothetical protein